MNKKIHIFYLATDLYINFADIFFSSVHRCFPNIHKNICFFSDKKYEYNYNNDYIDSYENILITNLPYPYNVLFKINYMCEYIKNNNINNDDLFLFFDANTYILNNVKDELYNNIYNKLLEYDFIMLTSPWQCGNFENNNQHGEYFKIKNLHYVTYDYSQTSFFGGKISKLLELYEIYNEELENICAFEEIPNMYDQTMLNKIISEHFKFYNKLFSLNIYYDFDELNSMDITLSNIYNKIKNDDLYCYKYSYDSLVNDCFMIQKFNLTYNNKRSKFFLKRDLYAANYTIYCTYHDNKQIDEYNLIDNKYKHFKIFNATEKHDGYDLYYVNKYLAEFCTQYYVWKNNIKSDIVGFCHYRRQHFMTNEIFDEINNNKYYAFEKCRHDFTFNHAYNYGGLGYHIYKLREYIKNKYPNKVDKFNYIFNSTSEVWFCYKELYFCKWEVFDMIMNFVDGYIKFLFNDNRELYEYSEEEYHELTDFLNQTNWDMREDYGKEHKISFEGFFGYPRCLAFMCEFIIAFLFEFFDKEIKEI